MKKAPLFKSVVKNKNEILIQTWTKLQNEESTNPNQINLSWLSSENISAGSVALWDLSTSSWVINSNIQIPIWAESSTSASLASTNGKMLSGTTEYFGVLDIVGILWEKPQFTLQDSQWNYFAYYGDHLNFVQTIQSLGWNIYEMVTESEILQNQLFGDKVSYINLSAFKDIRVMMVIEIDGDVWLLQIPVDQYHNSKDYLKSLFIQ